MLKVKMKVSTVDRLDKGKAEVTLVPLADNTIPTDQQMKTGGATPDGDITLVVDNPSAIAWLTPGKLLYLNFTEAAKTTEQAA